MQVGERLAQAPDPRGQRQAQEPLGQLADLVHAVDEGEHLSALVEAGDDRDRVVVEGALEAAPPPEVLVDDLPHREGKQLALADGRVLRRVAVEMGEHDRPVPPRQVDAVLLRLFAGAALGNPPVEQAGVELLTQQRQAALVALAQQRDVALFGELRVELAFQTLQNRRQFGGVDRF